jgi:hypothetical protein
MARSPRDSLSRHFSVTKLAALLLAIALVGVGVLEFNSYSRTDGGHVMVIRNGGRPGQHEDPAGTADQQPAGAHRLVLR